ncbi:MAG: CHAP domain-containing protein [Nocardioidaceae bacterium]
MSPVRRRPLALAALALLATPALAACPPAAAPRALPPVPSATPSPTALVEVRAQQVVPPATARPRPSKVAPRPARSHAAARVRTALPTHRAVVVAAPPKPAVVAAPRPKATTAPAPRPATSGDSYPWRDSAGTANDTWGFTERQCVSYAAWRLSRAGHAINNSQGWGSAYNWDDTARRLGRTVSTAPRVGAVAQWNAGESSQVWVNGSPGGTFSAGSYGHVAYVTAVYGDGSVQVSQYNATGNRSYSSMRLRAPRYLYL